MEATEIIEKIYDFGIRKGSIEQHAKMSKGKLTEITSGRAAVTKQFIEQLVYGLEKIKAELTEAIEELSSIDEDQVGQYCVYEFVFPNGKRYYGSTIDTQVRWKGGDGYTHQRVGEAIKEYGWNNVKKRVIAKKLPKKNALMIEKSLIETMGTNIPQFGYNIY